MAVTGPETPANSRAVIHDVALAALTEPSMTHTVPNDIRNSPNSDALPPKALETFVVDSVFEKLGTKLRGRTF